jgi:hypothetical protein
MRTLSKLVEDLQHFLSLNDVEASELGWHAARNSKLVDGLLNITLVPARPETRRVSPPGPRGRSRSSERDLVVAVYAAVPTH